MFRAVKIWDEKWKILSQILTKILLFAQSKTLHKYKVKMQMSSIYEKILCLFSKARKFLELSYFHTPDRPSQNTLKLFFLLTYFPLITSVTELYSYHRKLNFYKFSGKLLKGRKFRQISKSVASSLHYKNKNLALAPEN